MRPVIRTATIAFLGGLGLSVVPAGATIFTSIASTTTVNPSGNGTFAGFAGELSGTPVAPSISGADVVFTGASAANTFGVYHSHAGTLSIVADANTAVPPGSNHFTYFRGPSVSGGNITFNGGTNTASGIYYLPAQGSLTRIADTTITPAGSAQPFEGFSLPQVDSADVSFYGDTPGTTKGIYRWHNGTLNVVVDNTTTVPGGGSVKFSDPNCNVAAANGNQAFYASSPSNRGIYTSVLGVLSRVADRSTVIPGRTDFFADFYTVSIGYDGTTVAFDGMDHSFQWGIYTATSAGVRLIAAQGGLAPDGTQYSLSGIELVCIDSGHLAFETNGVIYSDILGLARIVGPGDSVLGKTISTVTMGADAMSGQNIAFAATFTDGSSAIVTALVPEPSTLGIAATVVLAGMCRRQRKPRFVR